ncbi:metallophosphoesterase [Bradyrhizobium sp. U87765 SZCCT0131]|uniref:metallophosphoesterase family protein n=1 Tax=unclassified Bradyrhizobium TaxID=2631580 RepID=UPI001BABA517|nr:MULTISPECIES: metallophosphoesterase [unclassified Bradyrhizobium]MBR1218197.1 metallophosphoesterase [Bradyrhizobium sp. U87765 SZCCT0131]MBR1260857.1 metallophosphoesterase [Bradyrhizobium sp. U87765 SZCCT0134]MBR1303695.1 metallophosphoesterase [Bradyrhizobium sp. U87765 SZCCT0110]MBR1319301.1 metallophosphoesterase [Bradyrhizobium sp. U87765 SZCCT0109]MBR1347626.1 metallophosphoesterase [Bradyrhizobium sp. U87765 SZCCT0048]
MTSFTLAHLSDPHLAPMPRPRLRELAGKRMIGYVNWTRNRHKVHRREVIDTLVADLKAHRPDHIAVTGDLVNIALPAEISHAADWLHGVGPAADVTLVPGNHDAYVAGAAVHVARAWGDYMRGDDADAARFPFMRRRGPLTLIGVTTAVPTPPFRATGELGPAQVAALDTLLASLRDDNSFRVLLLHHPLQSAPHRHHARLTDSAALRALLQRHGVDLVLHGHDHRHAVAYVDGPATRIPVIGVPSASVAGGGHREPAAYNLLAIQRGDNGWHVEMTTRGLRHGAVAELRKDMLL